MFGPDHAFLLLIVLVLAVVFLGPKRLPEAGRSLGQAIRGFRHETKGIRDEISSIKDDTVNLRQEVTGMKDTVHSAVQESVTSQPETASVAAGPASSGTAASAQSGMQGEVNRTAEERVSTGSS